MSQLEAKITAKMKELWFFRGVTMSWKTIQFLSGGYWFFLHVFSVQSWPFFPACLACSRLLSGIEMFLFHLHPHWLETWPTSDHSQLFLTSEVTSPSYQMVWQLWTMLIILIQPKRARFAKIIWLFLLIEIELLPTAEQELNMKIIIISRRLKGKYLRMGWSWRLRPGQWWEGMSWLFASQMVTCTTFQTAVRREPL